MSLSAKFLAYGVPSLLISAVRLPASSKVVLTPLALSIALLAIPPTAKRWDTTDIPYLTLALAHVIVRHRTSQHYSSRGPKVCQRD